ncbi:hypothetical protein [Campylobacter sp. RM15925]|uniref:hypothetical protein n=1 Tax=Campylobacter sp. RM15925 TaxID=1705724 RepID=UPI001472CDAB|nr:hypothetical protein [Campylobacter sp. RM15925]
MREFSYKKPAFKYFIIGGAILAVVLSCMTSLFYSSENLNLLNFYFGLNKNLLLFALFFTPSIVSFLYLKFTHFKTDIKVFYNLFIMPFGELMIVVLLCFVLNERGMVYDFAWLFALLALPMFAVNVFQIRFAKFALKG